jgi:glutamate synthase domain-containing protein 3
MGFTLAKGITLTVEGDANDYIGKGLSGGKIAVFPSEKVIADGFKAEEHVVVGNVCVYGATKGKAFFRGKAGERFCVRNSGALAVVEGVGDHGCEYMTGGVMVCLGETGRNFAAGMSGGIAYIYDPDGKFPKRCNMGLVGLETIDTPEEKDEVYEYIQEHVAMTGSTVGKEMLDNWDSRVGQFVKVFPHDYKRVLLEREEAAKKAAAA